MPSTIAAQPLDTDGDDRWRQQHELFVFQAKEKECDVLFLGDSVLLQFSQTSCYRKLFEPLHCLNFCIYGDETSNVLWRIEHGELDGFAPKVVVIMVGHHNKETEPQEITNGILAVVKAVKEKQSNVAIVVMSLLPCGRSPNPKRENHQKVNESLQTKLSGVSSLTFLNVDWSNFVRSNGVISHRDMYDYMHPTEAGFCKFGEVLLEELQNILQIFLKTNAPSDSFCEDS